MAWEHTPAKNIIKKFKKHHPRCFLFVLLGTERQIVLGYIYFFLSLETRVTQRVMQIKEDIKG